MTEHEAQLRTSSPRRVFCNAIELADLPAPM